MENRNQAREGAIRPYEVDGIQECDNPLPAWWVGLFILTVVFAVTYLVYFHVLGKPNHIDQFNSFVAQKQSQETEAAEEEGAPQDLEAKLSDDKLAAAGQEAFVTNCAPCHQANGAGNIGPNLTDEYWIHGGKAENILHVIEQGVLEKGMPAWKDILGSKKAEELTALILSWRGKKLPGKEPQGELFKP